MRAWMRRWRRAPRTYGGIIAGKGAITACASVTATTTATLLLAYNGNRRVAVLTNTGTVALSLGPVGVTSGQGIVLTAGAAWVDSDSTAAWYGITGSGTDAVGVLEIA